jgi:hypothetical protein
LNPVALAELHSSRMPGPSRQTEHRILAAPLVRSIAETSDTDAPRQSSFDGSLHQFRREESQRDRHIDLSNAAFVARSNLLGTRDGAGNDLIKPMPATCDRCDERGASLSTNGSMVVRRHGRRRDDVAAFTDGTSAVEELPLELRGNSIPAHKHGRAPRQGQHCCRNSLSVESSYRD